LSQQSYLDLWKQNRAELGERDRRIEAMTAEIGQLRHELESVDGEDSKFSSGNWSEAANIFGYHMEMEGTLW